MAVTAAITQQCKQDWLNGVHQPGDVYKVALYLQANATLDKTTTAYTATGEVSGAGYSAGGTTLAGFSVGLTSDTAHLSFTDPSWANATITADAALIYNSTRSNKALCVLTFSSTASTNGSWTLDLPSAGASALLRIT
jgi:hypothetical protein